MKIYNVAVLGSGVMGSQIAAHLSNAGLSVLLFDLSQEQVEKGFQFSQKIKPAAYFTRKELKRITCLNYEQHTDQISTCDWIIEVIGEKLEWKHSLFKNIESHISKDAILTSNTSSLTTDALTEHLSPELKKRFFITHFFNPPRYLKLLEIISGKETDPKIVSAFSEFGETRLGKTIVSAKNTPGFIANRIGVYGIMLSIELQEKYKIPFNMIDKLTGTLIGRPKSATFRTADVVGLDTLVNVAHSLYEKCETDVNRTQFKVPEYVLKMVENGLLGQKSKQGFFKRDKKTKITYEINPLTLKYEECKKERYDVLSVGKNYTNLHKRLNALVRCEDLAGKFLTELLIKSCIYAVDKIPEISDTLVEIDKGMKTGFGWSVGPFEILDTIGLEYVVSKCKEWNIKIPSLIETILASGNNSFYTFNKTRQYFDESSKSYQAISTSSNQLILSDIKRSNGVIEKNWCASLIDIGNGVACLEFHSILQSDMNPVDGSIMDMLERAPRLVEKEGFKGLVLGHQGVHFSAGANLAMVVEIAAMKNWKMLNAITHGFQAVNQLMRFSPFPVVSAPFSLTLGGGYEMISAADMVVASAETYMGLVEVGAGVIPGGGGCLRLLSNWQDILNSSNGGWGKPASGPFPVAQKAFETIGFAKVSTSAKEAFGLGYLRPHDTIVMNQDQQIFHAKQAVLKLAEGYKAPEMREDLHLTGESGRLVIEQSISEFVRKGMISEYDAHVAGKLAHVLTGGEKTNGINRLNENDVLELEKEAFLSLCGEQKTQDRMRHLLKTGKPLRN